MSRERITPACAGNTLLDTWQSVRGGDHPRLRGEYPEFKILKPFLKGSPPLARGIHSIYGMAATDPGITPACAGNTKDRDVLFNTIQDHPRLRGEYK